MKDPLVAALAKGAGVESSKAAKVRAALLAGARSASPGHAAGVRPAATAVLKAKPLPVVPVRGTPAVKPAAKPAAPAAKAPAAPAPSAAEVKSATSVKAPARRLVEPPKADAKSGVSRRRYPRSELKVHARLALVGHPGRSFEATLPTDNISVGGVFFQSTFFLKLGTELEVTLTLGDEGREVRARGPVVRVETLEGQSGFAVRFAEYLDGSEVVLATHFLAPRLKVFLEEYSAARGTTVTSDWLDRTIDVLAAWELRRAELGGDVWGQT
ncbi:MAG: PilZ domain-containing protein [Myxococcaceae bacterium]|nr:PilZ domain-containing protein [Myxococcaceae bacterium]